MGDETLIAETVDEFTEEELQKALKTGRNAKWLTYFARSNAFSDMRRPLYLQH